MFFCDHDANVNRYNLFAGAFENYFRKKLKKIYPLHQIIFFSIEDNSLPNIGSFKNADILRLPPKIYSVSRRSISLIAVAVYLRLREKLF